jgi:hypothetical protein
VRDRGTVGDSLMRLQTVCKSSLHPSALVGAFHQHQDIFPGPCATKVANGPKEDGFSVPQHLQLPARAE